MDVRDKVVIITGASAGIGRETAQVFAQAGAKLALVARSTDALNLLADELRQSGNTNVLAVTTDMTNPAAVQQMVEQVAQHFGRIDILINNAGQAAGGFVAEVDPEHYHQIMELNIFGPLYAIQAVVPKMRLNGGEGGAIINISSNVSKMALPGIGAYASTKYALNGLSLTARNELAPENIRVIIVYPGLTATDFGKHALTTQKYGARVATGPDGKPRQMPTPDSAEHVARKILEAAQNEPAEQVMH